MSRNRSEMSGEASITNTTLQRKTGELVSCRVFQRGLTVAFDPETGEKLWVLLAIYRDVTDFVSHTESSREVPTEAWSETTIDNVAEIIGELVTESVFHRVLNGGKAALAQGNLDRAASMFQEAARLEPEASQPRELLEAVKEKQSSTSVS